MITSDKSGKKITIPSFDLPMSDLLSKDTLKGIHEAELDIGKYSEEIKEAHRTMSTSNALDYAAMRSYEAEIFYKTSAYRKLTQRYSVSVSSREVAGVFTEVFTPASGVSERNQHRILISLHGGAFMGGWRTNSHLESIPVAALGNIAVISIDYRLAPEYKHPAAREDVIAVYKALLENYQPEDIGIFGCSAGGLLTAQSIAWMAEDGLPLPGAIAMSAGAGVCWVSGDSGAFGPSISGYPIESCAESLYFKGQNEDNMLMLPATSPDLLVKFPPSLLISSTRDFTMSSVIYTHSELRRLGVEAELHIWEGLGHAFHMRPEIPEAQEANKVITKFFDKHLG